MSHLPKKSLRCEASFRLIYNCIKSWLVMDCQICQHTTIDFNLRFLQSSNKLAVAHAVLASLRINTRNPQGSERHAS